MVEQHKALFITIQWEVEVELDQLDKMEIEQPKEEVEDKEELHQ